MQDLHPDIHQEQYHTNRLQDTLQALTSDPLVMVALSSDGSPSISTCPEPLMGSLRRVSGWDKSGCVVPDNEHATKRPTCPLGRPAYVQGNCGTCKVMLRFDDRHMDVVLHSSRCIT